MPCPFAPQISLHVPALHRVLNFDSYLTKWDLCQQAPSATSTAFGTPASTGSVGPDAMQSTFLLASNCAFVVYQRTNLAITLLGSIVLNYTGFRISGQCTPVILLP